MSAGGCVCVCVCVCVYVRVRERERDLPADRAAGGDSEHCRSASVMCFESKKLDR